MRTFTKEKSKKKRESGQLIAVLSGFCFDYKKWHDYFIECYQELTSETKIVLQSTHAISYSLYDNWMGQYVSRPMQPFDLHDRRTGNYGIRRMRVKYIAEIDTLFIQQKSESNS